MRRLVSFLGIIAILALVFVLFWRVYEHHQAVDPDRMDERVVARVKIATPFV
jgi:hypothetical protein